VAAKFVDHFSTAYSCNSAHRADDLFAEYSRLRDSYVGLPLCENMTFDIELVSQTILELKRGKAAGIDGLSAEHLFFGHPILHVILTKLFQLIMSRRCVPDGFRHSYIVPLPKPKDCRNKAMTCDDYRGFAISPILSKVFEYCLLDRFSSVFRTVDNQFGFKKSIGCNHAIYTARKIVNNFISLGRTANLCALDLSKAFDKVNHHELFIKLMKRHIPNELLELFENWFTNCYSCIKWAVRHL